MTTQYAEEALNSLIDCVAFFDLKIALIVSKKIERKANEYI